MLQFRLWTAQQRCDAAGNQFIVKGNFVLLCCHESLEGLRDANFFEITQKSQMLLQYLGSTLLSCCFRPYDILLKEGLNLWSEQHCSLCFHSLARCIPILGIDEIAHSLHRLL